MTSGIIYFSSLGFSQVNCVKIDQLTGCTPFTVNVQYCGIGDTLLNGFNAIYDYDQSDNFTSNTFFTYTQPGLYDLEQIIAINNSQFNDAFSKTYTDTIRAVSTPELMMRLTPCSAKQLLIEIDSSSYDFYVLTNNLNTDSDTIIESGSLIKDFVSTAASSVEFTAVGQYFDATCSRSMNLSSPLLNEMTPLTITELSEFETPNIKFDPSGPFFYQLDLSQNESLVDSKIWDSSAVTKDYGLPISDYNLIRFSVKDRCQNQQTIFNTPAFGTSTVFENNKNTTTLLPSSLSPTTFDFIKYNIDSFQTVDSEDLDIICNQNTCYGALTNQTLGTYSFPHFASGDCGTSFSIDIPEHPSTYQIDHSSDNQTQITLNPRDLIRAYRINGRTSELGGAIVVEKDKTNDCFEFSFQNSCQIWSSDTTLCPLVLDYMDLVLSWNTSPNSGYHLLWGITDLSDTLMLDISSENLLEQSMYPTQEFCIAILDTVTSSLSNKICITADAFLFIPDLATGHENLKVKTRYIVEYNIDLFDLNGNLVRRLDADNLSLDNLVPNTYFYILRYETESGQRLETKNSLIIK